jgi:pimeloyl-ACP methyl ester carboxylesterase
VADRATAPGTATVPSTHGVRLHIDDHPGAGGTGAVVLAVHAAGFHGGVLAPLADALGGQGRGGRRVVAPDLRAHGRSTRPDDGDLAWPRFADDVLAVVDALGLVRPVGFGHSLGGAALVLAEARRPGTFAALHLFEPVVFPPGARPPSSTSDEPNPLASGARRRRRRFGSAEEAVASFGSRPPFDVLRADALRAYVAHGFRPDPGGGITLACDPEDEAQVYERGGSSGAWDALPSVACPVVVVQGDDGSLPGAWAAAIAARAPAGRHELLAGVQHFGPLQDPDLVAAGVAATCAAAGPRTL